MNEQSSNSNTTTNDNLTKDTNNINDVTNKIIFGKYRIINKIGEGSQSLIYSGENIQTKDKVAIKMEKLKEKDLLLKNEIYLLYRLKNNEGIANIITCGRSGENFIMIEDLLGKSLDILYLDLSKKFTILDICQIAIQCLDRLEIVHSKGIIHCDIKPENFVIGLKDPNVIYLIDFGLAHNYKSLQTGKHIEFSFTGYMTGTARYASRNALRGKELSRRDDLESFIYMILYFISKKLPWQGLKAKTMGEKYKKIYKSKTEFNYKEFCRKFPTEITICLEYILNMSFKEKPNYDYMRELFKRILEQKKLYINDYFSWMTNMKGIEIERKRAHSETRTKVIEQKRKIHSSILKLSTNDGLKGSTVAKKKLKLSKLTTFGSINLGESQTTVYEKDNNEENNIDNDINNFDVLNLKESDEIIKEEEEKNENEIKEEEKIENSNNLLSTCAKNKHQLEKYPDDELEKKYELTKELEVIKEEEEEYEEDMENRSKKRGGSELVYMIGIHEYDFDKKANVSKFKDKSSAENKKKDEEIIINSIMSEDKKDDAKDAKEISDKISNISESQKSNNKNIEKNENEIINDEIKKKENIEINEQPKNDLPQDENLQNDQSKDEPPQDEQHQKIEEVKKDENIIKREIEENKVDLNEEKEIKEKYKEDKKQIEEVHHNINIKNDVENTNKEKKNDVNDNSFTKNITNNNLKAINQTSKINSEKNLKSNKKNYTDDKIKYSSYGSEGYLDYMKKGSSLTQRDVKKKRGKGNLDNNKNKKDCNIF